MQNVVAQQPAIALAVHCLPLHDQQPGFNMHTTIATDDGKRITYAGWDSKEAYEKVQKLHPNVPVYIYPAGHGFVCDERGSYHAESDKLARQRTNEFFRKHLG